MASSGQVDVIISEKAIADIKNAITELDTLSKKILEVNEAGANRGGGINNNKEIVQELQSLNKLIATNKEVTKSIKTKAAAQNTSKTAHAGSANALNNQISKLKKQQAALTTSNRSWLQYEQKILKVKNQLNALTKTQSKVYINTKKQIAATNTSSKGFLGLGSSIRSVLGAFGLISGIHIFANIAKDTFNLVKKLDSLKFALESISDSTKETGENMSFLKRITKAYGAELVSTTERYINFLAAAKQSGVSVKATQDIFETFTKVAGVLGKSKEELNGMFLALEQMLSKGKVTTEELRRQLGERLPGALGIMATSLGVTLPELDKMLKAGEVLSAKVLPEFARQVELSFGISSVTKVNTLAAATARLQNSFTLMVVDFQEGGGVVDFLISSIDTLGSNLKEMISVLTHLVGGFVLYKTATAVAAVRTLLLSKYLHLMKMAAVAASTGIKRTTFALATFNKVLKANAIGIAITVITSLIFLFNKLSISLNKSVRDLNNASEEFTSMNDKANQSKRSIDKLVEAYVNLKKEGELLVEEQEELNRIMITLQKTIPASVVDVDDFGDAIEISTGKIKEHYIELRKLAKLNAEANVVSISSKIEDMQEEVDLMADINAGNSRYVDGVGFVEKANGVLKLSAKEAALSIPGMTLAIDKATKATAEQAAVVQKKSIDDKNALSALKRNLQLNLDILSDKDLLIKKEEDEAKAIEDKRVNVENLRKQIKKLRETQKTLEDVKTKAKPEDKLTQTKQLDFIAKEIKGKEALIKVLLREKGARGRAKKIDTSDIGTEISRLERLKEIERQKVEDIKSSNEEKLTAQEEYFKLSVDIEEQQYDKQLRLAKGNEDEITTAKNEHSTELLKIADKSQKDLKRLTQSFIDDELKEIQAANDKIRDEEIIAIKKRYADKGELTKDQEKELNAELAEVRRTSNNDTLKAQAEEIKKFLDLMKLDGEARIALERKIQSILAGIKGKPAKDAPKDEGGLTPGQKKFIKALETAQEFADAIADLGNAIFDGKIEKIDAEIEAEEAKYETLLALAEGDANLERRLKIQQEEDRKKLEKKRQAEIIKQAKFNKANALVTIGINTAIAITNALATAPPPVGLALAILMGALGTIQAAAVIAQPLPKFAEGGIMGHDGVALVGDGGQREVMRTPDGKLSVTPASNTLVNIPKGTEIFPSIADFNNEQPSYLDDKIYSATLLASISLNQKSIEGMMFTQRELDQRLLDEMIRNTNAVKKSKSNVNVKTQSIDIPHAMWRNNFTS